MTVLKICWGFKKCDKNGHDSTAEANFTAVKKHVPVV